jgi:dTDP-4-amino-4,6-dideoxygalactose transaminase
MTHKILSTSNLYEPKIEGVLSLVDNFSDDSGELIEGLAIQDLEARLCKYHKSKYCVSFNSGFWALVASIVSKSIEGRDEIIMPSLTYRRLADVVYWTKHTPVFVDINTDSLAISTNAVREAITSNTALILAVHPIVNCCNVNELINISKEYGIPIVFDAVESVHETYSGKRIGSFGVGEVFSLHASKLINGIEGGYVCTNDQYLSERLQSFRGGDSIGISSKTNDIHAIISLSSLAEINHNVEHNKSIYVQYKLVLSTIPYVRLLEFDESEQTSYKNIVIEILDNSPINRDTLVSLLNKKNILSRVHYYPPLHLKYSGYKTITTEMTNTEFAATRYVNLPCGSRVTVSDVERVCCLIKDLGNNE